MISFVLSNNKHYEKMLGCIEIFVGVYVLIYGVTKQHFTLIISGAIEAGIGMYIFIVSITHLCCPFTWCYYRLYHKDKIPSIYKKRLLPCVGTSKG